MPQDFSKMSDQELLEFVKSKTQAATQPTMAAPKTDFSKMSDQELVGFVNSKMQKAVEGPSFGEQAMDTIVGAGRTLASYTNAPTVAAVDALLRTDNEFGKPKPSILGNIKDAGQAFYNQFGNNPDIAPTMTDVAEKRLGLSGKKVDRPMDITAMRLGIPLDDPNIQQGPSPAEIVGGALEPVVDISNAIPLGAVAKVVSKGAAAVAKPTFGLASEVASRIGQKAASVGGKIAETKPAKILTGPARAAKRLVDDVVRPVQSKDYPEFLEIAKKNNIDLLTEQHEFGDDSFIGSKGRELAGKPGGAPRIEAHQKFIADANRAFDKKLSDMSSGGALLNQAEAGSSLRDGLDLATKELFETVDSNTYSQISKQYPGLMLNKEAAEEFNSKLNGVEKYAKGLISRSHPMFRSQGQMLLDEVAAARRTNGSFKQAVEHLQSIGSVAFHKYPVGQIPPDIEKTQDLYFSLRDALYKTLEREVKDGEEVAGALKISNDLMSKHFKSSDSIGKIISNPNLSDEQIFKQITANTKRINDYAEVVGRDSPAFGALKSSYLNNLIKRETDGTFSFNALSNALRGKDHILSSLFSDEEIKDITDLVRLAKAAGDPILNKSRTADSLAFGTFVQNLIKSVQDEVTLDAIKEGARARTRGISLPKETTSVIAPPNKIFQGARDFAPNAAIQLPKQMYIQRKNEEKRK